MAVTQDDKSCKQLPIWKKIAVLKEADRSVPLGDQLARYVQVVVREVEPPFFAEVKISTDRRRDLPVKGRGDLERRVPLAEGEYLRETTHALWIDTGSMPEVEREPAPAVGLLIVEFNPRGPRAARLAEAISALSSAPGFVKEVDVVPIVTSGALEKLAKHRDLRSIRVRGPAADFGGKEGPLAALGFSTSVANMARVDLTVSHQPWGSPMRALENLADRLKQVITLHQDWNIEVTFDDGETLRLEEALVMARAEVALMDPATRAVSSNDIFNKMRAYYLSNREMFGRLLGRKLG